MPFSYDPSGLALGPPVLDDANDRNFELVSGVLGERVASSFVLLRAMMLGVVIVVAALGLRAVPRLLPFFVSPAFAGHKAAVLVVAIVLVIISMTYEMFLSHDSLGVSGRTSMPIGTIRDGLWWVTYPASGWLLAILIPFLAASTLALIGLASRDP